ncbi:hypothetical protein ACFO0M_27985 [Micromonospora mangrovi]|uniref:GNAT family N-acetyltransferase n=2 Tax=Micromonospora TaxID=1873 RepID=A0AAU7MDU8_9ACTN
MSSLTPVVRARWRDIDRLVNLVTATVSATPLAAWLVPDEGRRAAVLAGTTRIWTEHALLFGDAFLLRDGSAATVWFHRYRPIPLPVRYADRLTETCGDDRDRFLLLDRALAARRPTVPHHHLAVLAVAPGPERDARAGAALAGAQRWMDTLGLPTYAEAGTKAQRDLYRRHGYADGEEFALPDGTTTRPMWRLAPFGTGRAGATVIPYRRPAGGRWTNRRNARVTGWASR